MTEDEMVGWCHRLDGHESEHSLGDGEGPGRLALQSLRSQRIRAWRLNNDWAPTSGHQGWGARKDAAQEAVGPPGHARVAPPYPRGPTWPTQTPRLPDVRHTFLLLGQELRGVQ